MKKYLVILFSILVLNTFSQITLQGSYPVSNIALSMVKFHDLGYKFVRKDIVNDLINIYNLNHTLYKAISIPSQTLQVKSVDYLSQRLFDNDTLIEYVLQTATGPTYQVRIYKENGTLLFFRDSATYNTNFGDHGVFNNQDPVFFNNSGTKLRLTILFGSINVTKEEIYNLPGTIPCITCSSGLVTGFNIANENPVIESPQFFPNPTSDQLKLKYKLPEGSHLAVMKVYDTQGKLVDEFKVTDDFDFIYLPTNYNNGLYLYSLIVDGKLVKTEKIVLNK